MTRPTTTERGYGPDHKAERERWRPVVEAGNATCTAITCLMPDRAIAPDEPWDLDHNDNRDGYRGPAHRRCNRSAGTQTANANRHTERHMTRREWHDT